MIAFRRRWAGFTLVELMITVVIVGVLASIAVPSMQQLILTQNVRTGASDLQTALYFARSEAIKRAANVDIVPCSSKFPPTCGTGSPDWTKGWVVQVGGGGAILRTQNALSDQLSTMTGTTITYRSDGRVTSTPATIAFTTSNTKVAARCIKIDLSGRPNVGNYASAGTNTCT